MWSHTQAFWLVLLSFTSCVCVCLCMEERERKRDSCCRLAIADWNALIFNQTKEWTPGNAGVDVWVWRKISTTSRFTIRILARIHCCSHGEEEQQKKLCKYVAAFTLAFASIFVFTWYYIAGPNCASDVCMLWLSMCGVQ